MRAHQLGDGGGAGRALEPRQRDGGLAPRELASDLLERLHRPAPHAACAADTQKGPGPPRTRGWASGLFANASNTRQGFELTNQLVGALPGLLSGVTQVVILALGGLYVVQGDMTIGMLIAFRILMGSLPPCRLADC